MLGSVGGERRPFHIAAVGDGDDHVLAGDEILVLDVGVAFDDLGPAGNREGFAHLDQLGAHHRHDCRPGAQEFEMGANLLGEFPALSENLIATEAGEA
jgi:hypothetical protein